MAKKLIYKYKITSNKNAGVGFDIGDEIHVSWDTDTESLYVVKRTGALGIVLPTGPNLGSQGIPPFLPGDYYVLEAPGYDFCDGTTFVDFTVSAAFPYATKRTTANAAVCGFTPCDIQLSLVSVTKATARLNGDGQIVVSATSSRSGIKYGLTDFDYNTAGQASGTFANLYPGFYDVYAKDEGGCVAILKKLWVDYATATYASRYTFTWYAEDTYRRQLQILQRDYAGAATDLPLADADVARTNWRGENQAKETPIIASELLFGLLNSDTLGEFSFIDLYTQDDEKYQVRLSVDYGSGFELYWQGFIAPQTYTEPYTGTPYEARFTAVDNLGRLAERPFLNDAGQNFKGKLTCMEAIAVCLAQTGSYLQIVSAADRYAVGMDTTAADDPLAQAEVDTRVYIDDAGNVLSCYDVLSEILRTFGCRLFQRNAQWWIVPLTAQNTTLAYRVFDADGVYQSNSTINPVKEARQAGTAGSLSILTGSTLEVLPAFGRLSLRQQYGLQANALRYGEFEEPAYIQVSAGDFGLPPEEIGPVILPTVEGFTLIRNGDTGLRNNLFSTKDGKKWVRLEGGQGRGYMVHPFSLTYGKTDRIKFSLRYELHAFASISTADGFLQRVTPPFVKVKWMLKIGNHYVVQAGLLTTTSGFGINEVYEQKYNEPHTVEIEVPVPPTTEDTTVDCEARVYCTHGFEDSDATSITSLRAIATENDYIGRKVVVNQTTSLSYYELIQSADADNGSTIIRPDDYDATYNQKVWSRIAVVVNTVIDEEGEQTLLPIEDIVFPYNRMDIDYIKVELLPEGSKPVEDGFRKWLNDRRIRDEITYTLIHGDRPILRNAANFYHGHLRLSDGTATTKWTRTGHSGQLPILEWLAADLVQLYKTPTFRISGPITWPVAGGASGGVDILTTPYTVGHDARYYAFTYLSIDHKSGDHSAEMVEIDTDTAEPGRAFSLGFSIGFNA